MEKEIAKLRSNTRPDTTTHSKLADLQDDLDELSGSKSPLAAAEATALTLRRQKLAESFKLQFEALQELSEKLAIVATYGQALVNGWDVSSQAGTTDYIDGERTAGVRSGVESALESWSPSKPFVPNPNIKSGVTSSYAPSFHESHRSELESIHQEDDPATANANALDSYYQQPASPTLPPRSSAPTASASTHAPIPIPGAGTAGGAHQQPAASPFVQQLNNAPVTSLPNVSSPPLGHANSGTGLTVSPHPSNPTASTAQDPFADPVATHTPVSGLGGGLPTVAETGAPILGTGGPSSGVLGKPQTAAVKTKEEEAREEHDRNFQIYSQGGNPASTSTNPAMATGGITGAEGEQLPAYTSQK